MEARQQAISLYPRPFVDKSGDVSFHIVQGISNLMKTVGLSLVILLITSGIGMT